MKDRFLRDTKEADPKKTDEQVKKKTLERLYKVWVK